MDKLGFEQPYFLILLLLVIPMVWAYIKKNKKALPYPMTSKLASLKRSKLGILRHLIFTLRCLAIICLILATARPQTGRSKTKRKTKGVDIILAIDTSGSMQALDFKIKGKRENRLYIAKKVLLQFIKDRPDDRIGIVVFGTNAFAQAPLTLDHDVLKTYLDSIEIGMAGDATAIGDAIGVSTNRLKDIESKSKIIVLLTDGENTAGKLAPLEVAKAAASFRVKIYSVGVGSNKPVPFPTPYGGYQKVTLPLDERLLKQLSSITSGLYFHAETTEGLFSIYETIDKLEKTEIETQVYYNFDEKFSTFAWLALLFLSFELGIRLTRFKRIP